MKLVLLLLLASLAHAGGAIDTPSISTQSTRSANRWHKLRRVSTAVLGAVSIADAASSHGLQERNPVLGTGPYGARQDVRKFAILGAFVLTQELMARKHPEWEKPLAITNFGAAAATGAIAVHNWRLK